MSSRLLSPNSSGTIRPQTCSCLFCSSSSKYQWHFPWFESSFQLLEGLDNSFPLQFLLNLVCHPKECFARFLLLHLQLIPPLHVPLRRNHPFSNWRSYCYCWSISSSYRLLVCSRFSSVLQPNSSLVLHFGWWIPCWLRVCFWDYICFSVKSSPLCGHQWYLGFLSWFAAIQYCPPNLSRYFLKWWNIFLQIRIFLCFSWTSCPKRLRNGWRVQWCCPFARGSSSGATASRSNCVWWPRCCPREFRALSRRSSLQW